jgi:FtsP/CotA-like multicopper oxidase with cupredoxin domain
MLPICTRRSFVAGGLALAAGGSLYARRPATAAPAREFSLLAAPKRVAIVGGNYPETDVWCYGGTVPGPEIRVRQGERLRVHVDNRLPEATTVHWHGLRVPNAMDGVPHLTQKPIAPGETFTYEFDCVDAGTFWYHPHQRSHVQVERGLSGALIVEEPAPIAVDRDVTWVLDDWRLTREAAISDDFGNMHDITHNGRVGSTVTVNGRIRESFGVRAGERIRLRLINAANARIFALDFSGHRPLIVALDGQPVEPHEPADGKIVLGSAMRADLILDMTARPGERFRVRDSFYRGIEYRLLDLVYSDEPAAAPSRIGQPIVLKPNALAEPDLNNADRHRIVLEGGMMGSMRSAKLDGRTLDLPTLVRGGIAWAMNGVAATEHVHEPMLQLALNRSYVLELVNETAWHHPMHLHGHAFRVLTRNGAPTRYREWLDTVLVNPRERVEIAFVADNPGQWMFHCHVLEHQVAGMMGTVAVD